MTEQIMPEDVELSQDAQQRLEEYRHRIYCQTDRLFAGLMIAEWLFGVLLAYWASPLTWQGTMSELHPHVPTAIILGWTIVCLPITMAILHPGQASTRHVIAAGQILLSALFIHLTGGRLETHFHVFGSLAFVAFYRDWRVLMTASAVTAADHLLRGLFWPESVYGMLDANLWRAFEHAGWVVFEDIFLVLSCVRGQSEMAEIALREAQLHQAFANVESQVAQRTIELEAERRRADENNRAKSEFLANMSHEIRTPMTAIQGFADVLIDDGDLDRAPQRRIQAIQTIRRNSEHLMDIINDILDISKIEAGKLEAEKQPYSPAVLASEVIALMRVRSQAKGVTLDVVYETPLPETITTDPLRLRQILVNLVGNAIKFTEVGGVKLCLRAVKSPSPRIDFDVVDTGLGINAETQRKLFQPFTQADSSTTRQFGGTGLGLSISRRLAEMLDGSVSIVESVVGRGTRMRLTLRLASADVMTIPAGTLPQPAAAFAPVVKLDQAVSLVGCRILLAEDGPDNQRLISFILRKAGAEVTVVGNGSLAVDAAFRATERQQPFDVILMDMQMPELDGYGAVAALRSQGYRGPVIALTAHSMSGDREKCLAAGCDDYATKPINRQELLRQIARLRPPACSEQTGIAKAV
ncbi:MAG TPA: ATP-binding protein [Planctomycetaceae bacterium]|nr:ATP-binding protein [Planctomycetaceae bacterium]